MNISKIRYPEMNGIIRLYPNPAILLGHEIFWQEKRDGSNIGVYLIDDDIHLRSRNLDEASSDFYAIFNRTEEAEKLKELLMHHRDTYRSELVIFGELLTKGKSPTRTEIHEKDEYIVFDIYSTKANNFDDKEGAFLPYMLVHQYCHHFDIPIVKLYGTSQHVTVKSLLKWRDKMLGIAEILGREGVVGKTFKGNKDLIYFKEKLDLPKLEKYPRLIEEGRIQLPQLSESEILGALDKVLVDLGFDEFKKVEIAMPLFAKYVKDECHKHNCMNKINLFKYYKQKLEEEKI